MYLFILRQLLRSERKWKTWAISIKLIHLKYENGWRTTEYVSYISDIHIAYLSQKTLNQLYREKRPPTKNRKHVLKQDESMKKSIFKHCRKSLQVDCWFVLELYVSPFVRFIFIFPCQQLLADKVCGYYCDANFFLCWACQKFIVPKLEPFMLLFLLYFLQYLFFLSQLEEQVNEFIRQMVISENFKR